MTTDDVALACPNKQLLANLGKSQDSVILPAPGLMPSLQYGSKSAALRTSGKSMPSAIWRYLTVPVARGANAFW
jgi:hypothetical protein